MRLECLMQQTEMQTAVRAQKPRLYLVGSTHTVLVSFDQVRAQEHLMQMVTVAVKDLSLQLRAHGLQLAGPVGQRAGRPGALCQCTGEGKVSLAQHHDSAGSAPPLPVTLQREPGGGRGPSAVGSGLLPWGRGVTSGRTVVLTLSPPPRAILA